MCPHQANVALNFHSGWSSCSGLATLTGVYELILCFRRLQINHTPKAENPIIRETNNAKVTARYCCCHDVLHRKVGRWIVYFNSFDHI